MAALNVTTAPLGTNESVIAMDDARCIITAKRKAGGVSDQNLPANTSCDKTGPGEIEASARIPGFQYASSGTGTTLKSHSGRRDH